MLIKVEGKPCPKGSYKIVGRGKYSRLLPMSKGLPRWEQTIADACQKFKPLPVDKPIGCSLDFFFIKPKSVKRLSPTVPPDLDKLCRAVLDGLQKGGVLVDDKQITKMTACKSYNKKEGVLITLTVLEEE